MPGAEPGGKYVFKTERAAKPLSPADLPPSLPVSTSLPVPPEFADDDGCVSALFKILWAKHCHTNNSCTGIDLPDTILYRFRTPALWYFTASNGQICRKHKVHVTSQLIYDTFTKGIKGPQRESTIAAIHIAEVGGEGSSSKRTTTTIEHLTVAELREFLFKREKADDGLLQRFVPPRDGQNHTYCVVWSPEIIMLERRQNVERMGDTHAKSTLVRRSLRALDPQARSTRAPTVARRSPHASEMHVWGQHRRALTLEDEAGASVRAPIKGGMLSDRLKAACEAIVQHAAAASAYRMRLTRGRRVARASPEAGTPGVGGAPCESGPACARALAARRGHSAARFCHRSGGSCCTSSWTSATASASSGARRCARGLASSQRSKAG